MRGGCPTKHVEEARASARWGSTAKKSLFLIALFLQNVCFAPLLQYLSFMNSHHMGHAAQDFILVIRDIKEVSLGLADPLQDFQDPFPVGDIETMTGFIDNQKGRGFHHGPCQQDHSFLPVGKTVLRLLCNVLDTKKLYPSVNDLFFFRRGVLVKPNGIIKP